MIGGTYNPETAPTVFHKIADSHFFMNSILEINFP